MTHDGFLGESPKVDFNVVETWAKRKPLHTPIGGGGGGVGCKIHISKNMKGQSKWLITK
jgi:hypothetical protein